MNLASTSNVALCYQAIDIAVNRNLNAPGLLVFHGHSGLGKTMSLTMVAHTFRAYYVQVKSVWTTRDFLRAVLHEMGISTPSRITVGAMMELACAELSATNRPLLIDEADHLADKKRLPIVMDLYEGSGTPVMLIGEERLPAKIAQHEKIHNRVLKWIAAQPCSRTDFDKLAAIYAPQLNISDDLAEKILDKTHGVTRRVSTTLIEMADWANSHGINSLTAESYQGDIFTQVVPRGRGRV